MGNHCGKSVTDTKKEGKSVSSTKNGWKSVPNTQNGGKPTPDRTLTTKVKHLGIVPDGNRRYSRQENVTKLTAYYRGKDAVFKIWQAAFELGVHTVTIWLLSTDNFGRSKLELESLLKLMLGQLPCGMQLADKFNSRVRFIGQRNRLPQNLIEDINKMETETESRTEHCLNFALDYGGQDDIVEAIRKIQNSDSVEPISAEAISKNVWMAEEEYPAPDLIVRTGAKDSRTVRNSGFLIWQSVYSEFYYENKYMPECDEQDLKNWLRIYEQSEQRFGK